MQIEELTVFVESCYVKQSDDPVLIDAFINPSDVLESIWLGGLEFVKVPIDKLIDRPVDFFCLEEHCALIKDSKLNETYQNVVRQEKSSTNSDHYILLEQSLNAMVRSARMWRSMRKHSIMTALIATLIFFIVLGVVYQSRGYVALLVVGLIGLLCAWAFIFDIRKHYKKEHLAIEELKAKVQNWPPRKQKDIFALLK